LESRKFADAQSCAGVAVHIVKSYYCTELSILCWAAGNMLQGEFIEREIFALC